jgi:putative glycerol-1-phosphate prenyltransferase
MSENRVFEQIQANHNRGKKMMAMLIDPDKQEVTQLLQLIEKANVHGLDYFFIGGSLLYKDHLNETLDLIKSHSNIPTVLFPGSVMQVNPKADALLFISLISGRNPELLIGTHVIAAPYLRQSGIETIATGYMLIESGRMTTAHYVSGSMPIPSNKPEIAACTAMAGEMLGLKIMYLDGGSGADVPVSAAMIQEVRKSVSTPIIVGGGIKTVHDVRTALDAGADIIVVGNSLETQPNLLEELLAEVKGFVPVS